MQTTHDQIAAAIKSLQMPANLFDELPSVEAKSVFQRALDHFVGGDDRRWWWEAFSGRSVSRHVKGGWKLLVTLAPEADERIWFIAEDDQLPFCPVYDATPKAAEQIIGECFAFEYYLVAKDMSWLICENHHDILIGVGEPVTTRLSRLAD